MHGQTGITVGHEDLRSRLKRRNFHLAGGLLTSQAATPPPQQPHGHYN
jgi:hypothetical protein